MGASLQFRPSSRVPIPHAGHNPGGEQLLPARGDGQAAWSCRGQDRCGKEDRRGYTRRHVLHPRGDRTNWNDLGVRPSISDDGLVIVFYGDLTADGAKTLTTLNGDLVPMPLRRALGIFACVTLNKSPSSPRCTIRLAGVTGNGEIDPGERMPLPPATIELGPDFNYDGTSDWGLAWDATLVDSRSGASNFTAGSPTTSAFVSYLALDKANGSAKAVFSSRVNVVRDASGNLVSAGCEAPVRVLKTGDTVGSLAVSDLALHDSVNASGQTAIWVKTATSRRSSGRTRRRESWRITLRAGGPPQASHLH